MYTKEFKEVMGRGSDGLDHRRLVIPEKSPIQFPTDGQNASLLSSPLFQSRPVEWASDLMDAVFHDGFGLLHGKLSASLGEKVTF